MVYSNIQEFIILGVCIMVIIGAGIGGLCMAIALRGMDVHPGHI